jgi:hypothetical protein
VRPETIENRDQDKEIEKQDNYQRRLAERLPVQPGEPLLEAPDFETEGCRHGALLQREVTENWVQILVLSGSQ